jgi:hypothetical protein
MARIRTIKPGFFSSEDVSVLPMRARLTWIGLWTQCDDEGRTKDNTKLIKAAVWPLDNVTLRDIEEDLATLAVRKRIVRYEVDGKRYLAITNWREHQRINKPTPSKIPPPSMNGGPPPGPAPGDLEDDSRNTPGVLPESSATPPAGKGKEGKGKESVRAGAREHQAIRHLHARYGLTDDEADRVIAEVRARALAPITYLTAYLDGMTEGDLADIVKAVMNAEDQRERPPPVVDDTPVELRHTYRDDGDGACAECRLPASNRRHREAS